MLDVVKKKFADIRNRIDVHSSYERVFRSPDGERVLRHIMRVGFVTSSTFVAGDPHATAMNEGSRRLALSILKFVCKDHASMIKQIEEGIEDANAQ